MRIIVVLVGALCATLYHQVQSQGIEPLGEGDSCTPNRNPLETRCGRGLLCDYDEKKCAKAQTCAEKYAWFEENKHRIPDLEPPSCDRNGNYNLKQCYAQWTGNGHCSCVDRYNGRSINSGVPSRENAAQQMTCQCIQDKADQFYRNGYVLGVTFHCNEFTGDYAPARCHGSRCRCVTRVGRPINGYEPSDVGTSDCQCARDKHETTFPLKCKTDGSHYQKQCFGDVCFCVRRLKQNLDPMGSRRGPPGPPGSNADQC